MLICGQFCSFTRENSYQLVHTFVTNGGFYSSWCKHRQQDETIAKKLVSWHPSLVSSTETCRILWLYRILTSHFYVMYKTKCSIFGVCFFLLFRQFKSKFLLIFFSAWVFRSLSMGITNEHERPHLGQIVYNVPTSEMEWMREYYPLPVCIASYNLQVTHKMHSVHLLMKQFLPMHTHSCNTEIVLAQEVEDSVVFTTQTNKEIGIERKIDCGWQKWNCAWCVLR